jgi:hypothetical protein
MGFIFGFLLISDEYHWSKSITKPPVWGGQGPYKDCRAKEWMNACIL